MDRKYRGGGQGLGGGRTGSCLMGTVSVWEGEKVPELFHNSADIFSATDIYAEKW